MAKLGIIAASSHVLHLTSCRNCFISNANRQNLRFTLGISLRQLRDKVKALRLDIFPILAVAGIAKNKGALLIEALQHSLKLLQKLRCLRIEVFDKLLEELVIAELVLLVDTCAVSAIGIQARNSYSLSTRKEVVVPICF